MSVMKLVPPYVKGERLTYQEDGRVQTLMVGTTAWYDWLQTATTFTFVCGGDELFTARREQAGNGRSGWYWCAYYKQVGSVRHIYLGRSEELSAEWLGSVAVPLRTRDEFTRQPTAIPPVPLTSLVGRERELDEICRLLRRPQLREITLSGTGGVGKTRLALAVAERMRDVFPDGICFVSLAALHDADLVLSAIAQALDLQDNTTRSPLMLLRSVLHQKRLLLILDNFEQVIAAAPALLDLLATCPQLKLLVTSREILRVRGEYEFEVQPLAVPDPQRLSVDDMSARYSAVALFLERARVVRPSLELTPSTAPLIAEICRRLDGLPLALELAATRLKILSLPSLLERLEHRLQLLTTGSRDLPTRQQTLRQTIAWSYDLLSSEEQHLFRMLAVFLNGGTMEAVEEVYSALGGERGWVLDGVTSLLDKHLLHQSERGDDQVPRLWLHETLREYGLEELVAVGELERARQAHAEYYLGLTAAHLEGIDLVVLLRMLEWEYANLHAALQWGLEQPTSKIVARLGRALFHFWEGYGAVDEVEHSSTGGQHISDRLRARSLYILGTIAWVIGDIAVGRQYAEAGLMSGEETNEKITLAYLIDLMGQIAIEQREDSKARTLLERGLRLHREAEDTHGSLNSLFFLSRLLSWLGESAQARSYAAEHLALSRKIGFRSGTIGALTMLGRLALEAGEVARAGELLTESQLLLREADENRALAVATNLQGIGVTLVKLGHSAEAVRLWGAAAALCPLLPEERAFVARAHLTVRAQISAEAFSRAWIEGQAMTLEQALAAIGQAVPARQSSKAATSFAPHQPLPHDLTARQIEVLCLVARGLTDVQIAEALFISPRTVNAHLRAIYARLNITSRHAATYLALEHGLI